MTTWDEAKRRENLAEHGMDIAATAGFDSRTAVVEVDRDVRHGTRCRAIGWLRNRLCFLVYTEHEHDGDIHAISLRPATPKEHRRYAEEA
jgi:uncharacterized DUF497 family protein